MITLNNNIVRGYKSGVPNRQMFIHQHRKRKEKITRCESMS